MGAMSIFDMEELNILGFLTLSLGLKLTVTYLNGRKRKVLVGKVTDLIIYPLKSARGVHVKEALCTRAGLKTTLENGVDICDRHWMVTTADYEAVSLMDYPKTSLISTKLLPDGLLLTSTDLEDIKVPFDLKDPEEIKTNIFNDELAAYDCGEEAASWMEKLFGIKGLRLVFSAPHHKKAARMKKYTTLGEKDAVAFAWSTPTSILTEASLADLNIRLEKPIDVETLRMNIVVDGHEAYEEEKWEEAIIGSAEFSFVKLCDRCRTIEVDIDKGKRYNKNGPLSILRKYRPLKKEHKYAPILGIKHKTTKEGLIKIGDPVYAWI